MRKAIFSLLLLLTYLAPWAQNGWTTQDQAYASSKMEFKANRVVPPSPDAAELGKYGNVPVSLFTGTPNIQVPLYELKGSSLSLPISLSYNAGGFKPQDIASWVGLGWTLNAGGAITRSVVGNPDNSDNYFNARNNTSRTPPVTNDLYATYDFIDSLQKGWNEMQPDIYYYNFAGYSGKFFVSSTKQIIRKETNNLKITCQGIENDATGSSYFQIIDERGNTFRFDQVEISNMFLDDGINQNTPATLSFNYPSTWYLSSITSPDGNEVISFSYVTTTSTQKMFSAFLQNESYQYYHNSLYPSAYSYDQANPTSSGAPPMVSIYNRKYLQSISLSRGGATVASVSITHAVGQRQDLDQLNYPGERIPQSLTVSSFNGPVKKFNLYYSYFTAGTNPSPDYKRLRLDSVAEAVVDGSNLKKPPFSFVYDNSEMRSVPYGSIDHWGFSNGGTVTTLVPKYSTGDGYIYGGGANRDASLQGSMTGVLKQINYPSGGYTAFDYELNQAYDSDNHRAYDVGGLRVKKITDFSFPGKPAVVKNYTYTLADGTSSGQSYIPSYVRFSSFHHWLEEVIGICNDPCLSIFDYTISMLTVSASSVASLGTIAGSHIGYSYVTESQSDANTNVPLGKTVYHYKVGMIGPHIDDLSTGDLLDRSVYDLGGKLLSSQVITYNYAPGDGSLIAYTAQSAAAQENYLVMCKKSDGTYVWKGEWQANPNCASQRIYKLKSVYNPYVVGGQWKQSLQIDSTYYDQVSNNYLTTTKKFTYGSSVHTFPTLTEWYSSSNDEIVTSKKYAGDYTVPGSGTLDAATLGIKKLQEKNMLVSEIETLIYRQNRNGTNKRYIDGTISFYEPATTRLSSVSRLELAAPVTTIAASTTNGTFTYDANYKPQSSIVYDVYGNLSEQSKNQDVIKAYKWDYNHSLPVAEVSNANATMIGYTSFENGSDGGGWTYASGDVSATYGGRAGDKAYVFSGSNTITKTSLPSGRTYIVSYYLRTGSTATVTTNTGTATAVSAPEAYLGWRLIEHVLPAGSTQVTISNTAGSAIDELKIFPKDAQMTTYTYTPSVGMTAQCTPSNQYTFYEYDGFLRLFNILDMQKNIVKNFRYNYGLGTALTASAQTMWYNNTQSGGFTKSGCPAGTEPTTVTYVVPYGRYVSSISQADADAKAVADVNANGPGYATANGKCLYWNTVQFGYFTKTCQPSEGTASCINGNRPFNTKYQVAAHTYSSEVSQAAADAVAQADVTANGPAYAETQCTCSCSGEGKKSINGVCTTGTRWNVSSTNMGNGTWKCVYYYEFSDGTTSGYYTVYNTTSTACPIQ